MLITARSLMALATVSAAPWAMAQDAQEQGFIEDSHLKVLARNLYWDHDTKGKGGDQREWGQGLRFDYTSGFTTGTVGLGLDVSGYSAFKLDGGRGRAGAGVLVPDGDGAKDAAGSGGGAVKLRVSATELRYGNNLRPYNPVFAPADTRLLPATATGFWLTSAELEGLNLEAAHLTAAKDFNSTNSDDDFYAAYAGVGTSTVDFLGGTYAVNDRLSLSLYTSRYEDIWRQTYVNSLYALPLSDTQSLSFDFNLYRTDDDGRQLAGKIDVTAWSMAVAYTQGAHTFKLTHQRIDGDQPFDYLGMGPGTYHDSIYLANSSQLVDFNGPNERSWGAFYDLDMSLYGVPGLTFQARYIRGTGVDGSKVAAGSVYDYYADSEDHWERDLTVRYVVQSGPAKDLSLKVRQATHRIGNGKSSGSADQVRVIVEYPIDVF
ncbi:OprD family porin [Pseudomonas sp. UBA6562]|uniref:OprD family porin n=1 Tax=Pseudomonas sp. UBA6562 TaxID=1947332 RepID=UPI0025DAEDA6|nr:OprD family porin [Pseudomonas sp. UBA6562]